MRVIFESIVKSENNLPEGRKIIRGFSLVPQIPVMARREPTDDPAGTKASCKSKESGVPRRAKWFCHQ